MYEPKIYPKGWGPQWDKAEAKMLSRKAALERARRANMHFPCIGRDRCSYVLFHWRKLDRSYYHVNRIEFNIEGAWNLAKRWRTAELDQLARDFGWQG